MPAHGVRIVVDHIRPVRTRPHLRLKLTNLQILCDACNVGKGRRDRTDWWRRR
jgi:5-methylcytosine-specific restriction endonuclease McrA